MTAEQDNDPVHISTCVGESIKQAKETAKQRYLGELENSSIPYMSPINLLRLTDVFKEALMPSEDCVIVEDSIALPSQGEEPYYILLSECADYPAIIGWMTHLSDKRWVTSKILLRFALIAARYHDLPVSYP